MKLDEAEIPVIYTGFKLNGRCAAHESDVIQKALTAIKMAIAFLRIDPVRDEADIL